MSNTLMQDTKEVKSHNKAHDEHDARLKQMQDHNAKRAIFIEPKKEKKIEEVKKKVEEIK